MQARALCGRIFPGADDTADVYNWFACFCSLAVDIQDIRRFGARASLAAATGVLMPTLLSFALYSGVLGAGWKVQHFCFAAHSCFSMSIRVHQR